MPRTPPSTARRDESLSRDRIIAVAIQMLDTTGEPGLTFRALAERLATGPGAIYWHVANKSDLVTAACDAVISAALDEHLGAGTPRASIRALALALFDVVDAHPWIGAALSRAPGQMPGVRILERIGQQVRALKVPPRKQWATTCALMSYILGASQQNAANAQFGRTAGIERDDMLDALAATWSAFDGATFPFTRSMASKLREHDDRADFLVGVDLMLEGVEAPGHSRLPRER